VRGKNEFPLTLTLSHGGKREKGKKHSLTIKILEDRKKFDKK